MNSSNAPTYESMTQVSVEKMEAAINLDSSSAKLQKTLDKDVEKATTKSATGNTVELDDEIYNKFSKGKKNAIVAIVSFAALLARMCYNLVSLLIKTI